MRGCSVTFVVDDIFVNLPVLERLLCISQRILFASAEQHDPGILQLRIIANRQDYISDKLDVRRLNDENDFLR